MENKFGIEETKELLTFLNNYIAELKKKKANDGKVDLTEALTALGAHSEAAITGALGSWNVPKEIRDLNDQEKEIVFEMSVDMVCNLAELLLDVTIKRDETPGPEAA